MYERMRTEFSAFAHGLVPRNAAWVRLGSDWPEPKDADTVVSAEQMARAFLKKHADYSDKSDEIVLMASELSIRGRFNVSAQLWNQLGNAP